jgi:hypothetical protein
MEISFLFVLYLFDRQIQIANTLRCYLPRFVKLSAQIDFRTIPGVGFPQGALLSGNSAPEGDPVTKDETPISAYGGFLLLDFNIHPCGIRIIP